MYSLRIPTSRFQTVSCTLIAAKPDAITCRSTIFSALLEICRVAEQEGAGVIWRAISPPEFANLSTVVFPQMTIPCFSGIVPGLALESTRQQERAPLRTAIQEFLTTNSSKSPRPKVCPRCGQTMQYIGATFAVYGGEGEWNVQLPVCPCSLSPVCADETRPDSTWEDHRSRQPHRGLQGSDARVR